MKKFYSVLIALSAAVVLSASATGLERYKVAAHDNESPALSVGSIRHAEPFRVNLNTRPDKSVSPLNAPAKAAPATIADLEGFYDISAQRWYGGKWVAISTVCAIAKGDGENAIVIKNFLGADMKGTVDFNSGKITFPVQFLWSVPESDEEPGVARDAWLYADMASQTAWADTPVTMTINANGSVSCKDGFMFGIIGKPGYIYGQFADVTFTPNTELNTTITLDQYEVDANDYFTQDTYSVSYYSKATLEEDYQMETSTGVESFGECVILTDPFGSEYDAGEYSFDMVLQVERDGKEISIVPTLLFAAYFQLTETGDPTLVAVFPVSTGEDKYISATFHDNIVTWASDWMLYAQNAQTGAGLGPLAKYKGATITLPFNLENPGAGISDVIADSDANAPVEFFNLQGARISNPAAGQLVIRRQGKTVTKVFVK